MGSATSPLHGLTAEQRGRLEKLSRDVSFPRDTRIFDEGREADRFWILRTGSVALDLNVPGRPAPIIETLGPGELLGWSWLVAPHAWQLGARAATLVRADAAATALDAVAAAHPDRVAPAAAKV